MQQKMFFASQLVFSLFDRKRFLGDEFAPLRSCHDGGWGLHSSGGLSPELSSARRIRKVSNLGPDERGGVLDFSIGRACSLLCYSGAAFSAGVFPFFFLCILLCVRVGLLYKRDPAAPSRAG